MSSKRYSSLLLTALFVSSTVAANAGSKSMLDPYAAVQAPPSKKPKAAVRPAHHESVESTHTTYISMPIPADQKPAAGKKFGLFGGGPKQAKQPKQPKEEQVAESNEPKGDGIAAKSIASVKNAGSGIVGGTKAAGSKIAEGSKAVGGGIVSGTKKVGSGIASGAKASGGYIMKGVSVIGSGFKATGEKVKGGAGAAGTKVAGLPKLWGKKDNDQEKAKQQAIAKAIAERNAAKKPAEQAPELAKDNARDAEWNEEVATSPADQAVKTPVAVAPVGIPAAKTNQLQAFNAKAPSKAKGQSKLAGITGGFTKAFGKLNVFAGKSQPTMIQPVIRPQVQVQSTASTPDAIPQ
jgi:hypothetical protein